MGNRRRCSDESWCTLAHQSTRSDSGGNSSQLEETQQCDGPCKRLFSTDNLRAYPCGHVICGYCFTELPLKGMDEKGQRCMIGECRLVFERERNSLKRSNSINLYLRDAGRALRYAQQARNYQPPQAAYHLNDESALDSASERSQRGRSRRQPKVDVNEECTETETETCPSDCSCVCSDCRPFCEDASSVTSQVTRLSDGRLSVSRILETRRSRRLPDGSVQSERTRKVRNYPAHSNSTISDCRCPSCASDQPHSESGSDPSMSIFDDLSS